MTKTFDVAAWPELAEALNLPGEDEVIFLARNGRIIAKVIPTKAVVGENPKKRVWGSHPNAVSYIADDFDAELLDSSWSGENETFAN